MPKQRCLGQELSQFNMFHKIRKAWCHVGVLLLSSRIPLLEGDENVTNFMFHGFRSSKPCCFLAAITDMFFQRTMFCERLWDENPK